MGGRRYRKGSPEAGHTRLHLQGGTEFMTDDFAKVLDTMTAAATEPEDYAGEEIGRAHV